MPFLRSQPFLCFLLSLFLLSDQKMISQSIDCPGALSAKQKESLTEYVKKRYKLPNEVALSLKRESLFSHTCYRELSFEGTGQMKTWDLTLYASPDLRFLSGELFDTELDPLEEERIKNLALMQGLTEGALAVRGSQKASVSIVEFSDFECPFCSKFAKTLDEALADGTQEVRVVFHHLPLPMHPWARAAAEGAACAELQGGSAFWSLHDQLFQHQDIITADNIKSKLMEFAKDSKGLDLKAFKTCTENSMSLGIVLRDMNLADANQINGTPTLFINGHRVQGVENATKLRELIAEAQKETVLPKAEPSAR